MSPFFIKEDVMKREVFRGEGARKARNPYVVACVRRRAGSHAKTNKAVRRSEKMRLANEKEQGGLDGFSSAFAQRHLRNHLPGLMVDDLKNLSFYEKTMQRRGVNIASRSHIDRCAFL